MIIRRTAGRTAMLVMAALLLGFGPQVCAGEDLSGGAASVPVMTAVPETAGSGDPEAGRPEGGDPAANDPGTGDPETAGPEKTGVDAFTHGGFGTPESPYSIDMDANALDHVSGALINAIGSKGETWRFIKAGPDGKQAYAWGFAGRHMSSVEEGAKIPLGITLIPGDAGVTADFAYEGPLPGGITLMLQVGAFFPDASIVSIIGPYDQTAAVVAEGGIEFALTGGGDLRIADTGKTVSNSLTDGAKADESANVGENEYVQNKYRGGGAGTELDPLTILGDLSRSFQASWKSMNTLAGFAGGSYSDESTYDSARVRKAMVEYRDPQTGRLRCSVYIDGSKWQLTTETDKGPYYLDYRLNPDSDTIRACLEAHSLYVGSYAARLEPTLEALNVYAGSETAQLLYISRTREFAGPLVYRLDVSAYYKPGDQIRVEYLLGAANGHLYHGLMPSNASLLLLEPSYSKYDVQAVTDDQGYVSFPVYNGGFFTLSQSGAVKPETGLDAGYGGGGASAPSAESAGEIRDGVVIKTERISEEVAPDTQIQVGVLQENQGSEAPEENFFLSTEDGMVTVDGNIGGQNLSLKAENLTAASAAWQPLFADIGQLKEVYEIALYDPEGNRYALAGHEYLNVTIRLEGAYSIHDLDRLTVRHIQGNRTVSDAFFSSESRLDPEGKTAIQFKTTHLSVFAVVLGQTADAPAAIVQERIASNAASLAQTPAPIETDARPIMMIVLGTVILLGAGGAAADRIMARQRESG